MALSDLTPSPDHFAACDLPAHLDQAALARRWCISPRTLERWRWAGQGPAYMRLGGRAIYRLLDVERYELQQLRGSKPEIAG